MIKNRLSVLLAVFIILTTACSSSKWVVENQNEIDRNDFELIESVQFLERSGQTTPDNPIVSFNLKAANTFQYAQRVRTDRYIQRYTPSLKSILLGVAGAGLATSAAIVVDQPEINKQVLFGTAGFLTLSSFLNMKPTGDPTPTGESRLLRKTGTITETDTVRAAPIAGNTPSYTVYYNREAIVLRNDIPYVNGSYSINLIDELNPENFEYDSSDAITLEVYLMM